MVKRLRLNDKTVRELIPEEDRDYQVFDTEIRGLSIRVLRSGARSFVLDYRFAGRQRRMAIGRWPEWSVTAVRERARELRRVIDEGCDPLGERGDLREAPRFKDMIDQRCCRTQSVEDSHRESMRLDGSDDQAPLRPLPHDELEILQRCPEAARVAADLAGQGDGVARAQGGA